MTPISNYRDPTKDGGDGQRERRKQTNKQTTTLKAKQQLSNCITLCWKFLCLSESNMTWNEQMLRLNLSIVEPQVGSKSSLENSDVMSSVKFAWCCRARFQAPSLTIIGRLIGNKNWTFDECVNGLRASSPFGRASERRGEGRGGGGGGGGGGEKNRPLLSLPASRCRVSSHVPLARILFAISPNGKLACMLGGVCLRRLIFLIMRAKNKKKWESWRRLPFS